MEAILFKILSEQGLITAMLVGTLYFIIKVMKWGINNYLVIVKEHNERFLESLNKIVINNSDLTKSVILGNKNHTEEHTHIVQTMENIDKNVQKNTDIMQVLHRDVLVLHKK